MDVSNRLGRDYTAECNTFRILDSWGKYDEHWVDKLAIGGKCGGSDEESIENFQFPTVAHLALLLDGGCY